MKFLEALIFCLLFYQAKSKSLPGWRAWRIKRIGIVAYSGMDESKRM